jgi:hypothetical protein
VPGVEVIGPLPGDLQVITVFSAALDAKAKDNETAKAFVKFISTIPWRNREAARSCRSWCSTTPRSLLFPA